MWNVGHRAWDFEQALCWAGRTRSFTAERQSTMKSFAPIGDLDRCGSAWSAT